MLRWVGVSPQASNSITVHDITDTLSISVTSAVARVLKPHGLSNAGAMGVATCIAMIVLATMAVFYRDNGLPLWRWPSAGSQTQAPFKALIACEWAGVVTAALVFSPDTNNRHLVLAVLVNTLAAVLLLTPGPRANRAPVLAAVVLIAIGFIMPLHTPPVHRVWCFYSVASWGLLIGYLLIARSTLIRCRESVT